MGKVRIDIIPWLAEAFGQKGSSRLTFEGDLVEEMPLDRFLASLAEKYPAVHKIILDPVTGKLYEHVNIVHNDKLLGADADLGERIKDGDSLMFLPSFVGG